ncbi:gamma-glutamyl hydrolase-like [Acropora millepora]|uniref:gamma-glutamyl hydrolase-like n=1 Tax=Acropora millepora TaxID=45264 RepID=UPI001CF20AD0|nr:gamma-glutamyl hydrolase-like [Acropora millepora]
MKASFVCLCIALFLLQAQGRPRAQLHRSAMRTDRPIIGILAQNTGSFMNKTFGSTYIAASYIKYIESAGGRVVPIKNDLSEKQLEFLFNSINGVLFPGGAADLFDSPYERTAKILFNLAVKANKAGDVFPLWGTCLGFAFLSICGAGGENVLSKVDGENYSVNLNLSVGYQSSRLFGSAPEEIITFLMTKDVTFNHHQHCVSTDEYHNNQALKKFYRLLSTNRDKEGKKQFVSTIEAYDYPFYGTQWHPEKNSFEWTSLEAINHSKEAVLVTQYVANFFVDQARLSGHRFADKKEEENALIYQHAPVFCLPEITAFEQCYIF